MDSVSSLIDMALGALGPLLLAGFFLELGLLHFAPSWIGRLAFLPCGLDRRLVIPRSGDVSARLPAKLRGKGYVGVWEPARSVATVRSAFGLNGYRFLGRVEVQTLCQNEDPSTYRANALAPREIRLSARWLPVPITLVVFCLVVGLCVLENPSMAAAPLVAALLPTAVGYFRVRRALVEVMDQIEESIGPQATAEGGLAVGGAAS